MLKDFMIIANSLDAAGLYSLADRIDFILRVAAINYESELKTLLSDPSVERISKQLTYLKKDPSLARKSAEILADSLKYVVSGLDSGFKGPAFVWAKSQIMRNSELFLKTISGDSSIVDAFKENLEAYGALKTAKAIPAEYSNILELKDSAHLDEAIAAGNAFKQRRKSTKADTKTKAEAGKKLLAENEKWSIYRLDNREAAVSIGRGTKWCTSVDDPEACRYDDYTKRGPLYVAVSKVSDRKYQFHPESGELVDNTNNYPKPAELAGFDIIYSIPELDGKIRPVGDLDPSGGEFRDFMGAGGTVDENGEMHSYNGQPSLITPNGVKSFHNHGSLIKRINLDGVIDEFLDGVKTKRTDSEGVITYFQDGKTARMVYPDGGDVLYRDEKPWSGSMRGIGGIVSFYEDGQLVKRIGSDGTVYKFRNGGMVSYQYPGKPEVSV